MTNKNRFLNSLLAVILAAVMLSSITFIAAKVDHDCYGEDCLICQQITTCQDLLEGFAAAGGATVLAAAAVLTLCCNILLWDRPAFATTLVSLKVEFLN